MSAENDLLVIALVVLALLIALGWYLSYSAARLDRLHAKVEGAMSVLDAQLVRRAEASSAAVTASGASRPAWSSPPAVPSTRPHRSSSRTPHRAPFAGARSIRSGTTRSTGSTSPAARAWSPI